MSSNKPGSMIRGSGVATGVAVAIGLTVVLAEASGGATNQLPALPPVPAALRVPEGFQVSVFASGLTGARLMALSPEGVLVVARRSEVVALPDSDGDGRGEPRVLLSNLTYAHSVAFANGALYIATTPAVLRVKWVNGAPEGTPESIITLPSSTPSLHTSRSLRFGPDGRLYVAIGSSCNGCVEDDPRRTTVQVYDRDGRNGRTFARGLRNAVGFDWDPRTGLLWAGDAGMDHLGSDAPPDEINLVQEGRDYGHPYFYGRNIRNDVHELRDGKAPPQSGAMGPAFELPAHVTPMGVAFWTGTRFPEAFRTSMFVAVHGAPTRSPKVGFKVLRIVMEDGRPVRSEDFVTGWLADEIVTGRPVGIVAGADGALYISDDYKGFIYRVTYVPKPSHGVDGVHR